MEKTESQSALIESEGLPTLPKEIWLKIFSYLSPKHLRRINLVCHDWYELSRAPELNRKLKLVITMINLRDIRDVLDHVVLQYENAEIGTQWDEFSATEHEILLNIFIKLGPSVVELKLYSSSILSVLNDVLPNLKALDLLHCERVDDRAPVDLNKFSKLKSLLMPFTNTGNLLSHLMPSSTQMTKMKLEKLSFGINYPLAMLLDVLAIQAHSLRWLKFGFCDKINSTMLGQLQETLKKCTQLETLDIQSIVNKEYKAAILESFSKENRPKIICDNFLESNDDYDANAYNIDGNDPDDYDVDDYDDDDSDVVYYYGGYDVADYDVADYDVADYDIDVYDVYRVNGW